MDGSSPLARGTPLCQERHNVLTRFIPACAGNSFQKFPLLCLQPVHPRLRGELVSFNTIPSGNGGSSPLARGTPSRNFRCFASSRFIPACAGNSSLLILFHQATAVHPRLRGELPGPIWSNSAIPRFIPACAGNSNKAAFLRLNRTVHPRLRGELSFRPARRRGAHGSSPLARGTLRHMPAPDWKERFIPACAGNSFRGDVKHDF